MDSILEIEKTWTVSLYKSPPVEVSPELVEVNVKFPADDTLLEMAESVVVVAFTLNLRTTTHLM